MERDKKKVDTKIPDTLKALSHEHINKCHVSWTYIVVTTITEDTDQKWSKIIKTFM